MMYPIQRSSERSLSTPIDIYQGPHHTLDMTTTDCVAVFDRTKVITSVRVRFSWAAVRGGRKEELEAARCGQNDKL